MERYDYRKAMKEDILNYIKDNNVLEEYEYDTAHDLHELLNDQLWADDSITGNGPYGYEGPAHCEEHLNGNLRLLLEALHVFGQSFKDLPQDDNALFQYADATIRCYLLWKCIGNALKELGFEEDY